MVTCCTYTPSQACQAKWGECGSQADDGTDVQRLRGDVSLWVIQMRRLCICRQLSYSSADIRNIRRISSSGQQTEEYVRVLKSVHLWMGGIKPLGTPKQQARTSAKLGEAKAKDLRSLPVYMTRDDKLYMEWLVDSHQSM